MALMQSPTKALGTGDRARVPGLAVVIVAVVVALVCATVIAAYVISRPGSAAAAKSDPLVGKSAIEFRAAERAGSGSLARPAAEMRGSPHGAAAAAQTGVITTTDPLLTQSAIDFRNGEHGAVFQQRDPLLVKSAIDFRNSERGAALPPTKPLHGEP